MNKKQWLGLGLVAVAAFGLAACGNRSSRNAASSSDVKTKAAIVTDTGGVDDKSFNQSAWEGLQAWGKEHNLSKDKGYTYFQSTSEADYANNLQQAAGSYNLIFGVGFALHNAVEEAAKDHSDLNYVLIDESTEATPALKPASKREITSDSIPPTKPTCLVFVVLAAATPAR